MTGGPGRPRVVVLQHVACESLGTLEPLFAEAFQLEVLRAYDDPPAYHRAVESLVAAGDLDGLVALGGPMSVYDHAAVEGLDDSLRLLRAVIHWDAPILGICLGSQLLAWALGAQVRAGSTMGLRKEIGWFPVSLTERGRVDPIFHGFDERRPMFHWHGDTFDLPEGAWHLASSAAYPNQAFRHGRWAYGVQFHVEVTPEAVEAWTHAYAAELAGLDHVDAAAITAPSSEQAEPLARTAWVLGERFVECVTEYRRQRTAAGG